MDNLSHYKEILLGKYLDNVRFSFPSRLRERPTNCQWDYWFFSGKQIGFSVWSGIRKLLHFHLTAHRNFALQECYQVAVFPVMEPFIKGKSSTLRSWA